LLDADPPGNSDLKRATVVDDDDGFRASLIMLLETAGWRVDAFPSVETFLAGSSLLDPGLLLLDLHLDTHSGLDLLERGLIDLSRFGVVMVTGAGDIQTAVRSIQAGALDFVEKPLVTAEVLDKLDHIHVAFQASVRAHARELEARRRVDKLSNRERDVLDRLLSGTSNKLIARELGLSPRTVEMHRARMLQKLSVKSTSQALDIARVAGLKPVDESGDAGAL
jgi:two-component system, LuxR family, response regulator FixJ